VRRRAVFLFLCCLPVAGMAAGFAGWAVAGVEPAEFVGSAACTGCHEAETAAWRGSHHALAMAEASDASVLGDFNDASFTAHGVTSRFQRRGDAFLVRTDGPDGKLRDYRVTHTFGWYPLQQYLVSFPDGKMQALGIAWDSRAASDGGQRWFHLYPDEAMDFRHPQHWTARDQTWNYQCAECHSTNLRRNYDLDTDSYRTTWSDIHVACEACHGPGSAHLEWAKAAVCQADASNGLPVDLRDRSGGAWSIEAGSGTPFRTRPRSDRRELEVCSSCHSRRGQIWEDGSGEQPPGESHATALLGQSHRLALLEEDLYFPDGQIRGEVFEVGSFAQSRMHAAGVTCSDCHDPHSLKLRAEGNALCTACHLPERYDAPAHHRHAVGTDGAACASCHMPERVYMGVDWRADHSLRVPRPDLSLLLGTPNACTGCHRKETAQWAADVLVDWYPESRHRGAHFGEVFGAANRGEPDAARRLLSVATDASQPGIARASALARLTGGLEAEDVAALRSLLAEDDALVRAAAVRLLEVVDPSTQVELGWPLLRDPVRIVRLEAARILAALMRQGLPDRYREQLGVAVDEYVRSQEVNADRPESHVNLGLLEASRGESSRAEQAYRAALRLDSRFAPAYVNLADLYRQLGRDPEGEALLREGLEMVADDADLHYSLGLLLVRQRRVSEALPHLEKAKDGRPESAHYAWVFALALQRHGDVPGALLVLEEANRRHPAHRDILMSLVTMSRESGDLSWAKMYAERFVASFPDDPEALALRGQLSGE
jgi:tetratricopeptide (TPR) repeat protein/formate-dependent nitrite reductase cytochrome c552 subunit